MTSTRSFTLACAALQLSLVVSACERQEHSEPPEPDSVSVREPAQGFGGGESAASWSVYGFDDQNTQRNPLENTLSVETVAGLTERWRLHMVDGATSTPAIADGIAYFGGWSGNVFAVDAVSGDVHWQRRVTESQVNDTPLVVGDRLYTAAGPSLLALSRADGSIIFETLLDTHPTAMVWASPKLVDGMILIGVGSFENGVSITPTFTGSLVAVDADSGSEIWRVRTSGDPGYGPCMGGPGASIWSSVAIDEDLELAFVGTGQAYNEPVSTCSDSLLAVDYRREAPPDNRIRWKVQYTEGDIFGLVNLGTGPDSDIGASPNLFEVNGRALVGAGDKGGSYRAFDRATGEPVWQTKLELGPVPQFGGVTVTAAVEGETIYVASNHLETGSFVGTAGDHDPNDFSVLYALDTGTGQPRWSVKLPAPMAGSFAIANGVLYHPVVNRKFFARDLKTGAELWSTTLGNDPGSGVSVVDGRVYVSAGMALTGLPTENGGFVYSFGLEQGPVAIREARVDTLEPFTESQCQAKLDSAEVSETCSSCLCDCDPTAAGHCGSCSTLADCTALFCAFSAPGDETRSCLADYCNAKLLPSYVFDRAVDAAPCLSQCALACSI